MNVIFFIIQLVTIVHFQTNNNYYHVCYRERIFIIEISKLFVKSINLLRDGEKPGDRCLCAVNY